MRITTRRNGLVIRLIPQGALTHDSGNGNSLRQAAKEALKSGVRRVEVDASRVQFLDAAGLGELVACRAIVEQAGAEFMLNGARGKTRELLELTGLDRLLTKGSQPGRIPDLSFRVA